MLHAFCLKGQTVKNTNQTCRQSSHRSLKRKASVLPPPPTRGRGCWNLLFISPQIRTFCRSSCGLLAEETELYLFCLSWITPTWVMHLATSVLATYWPLHLWHTFSWLKVNKVQESFCRNFGLFRLDGSAYLLQIGSAAHPQCHSAGPPHQSGGDHAGWALRNL